MEVNSFNDCCKSKFRFSPSLLHQMNRLSNKKRLQIKTSSNTNTDSLQQSGSACRSETWCWIWESFYFSPLKMNNIKDMKMKKVGGRRESVKLGVKWTCGAATREERAAGFTVHWCSLSEINTHNQVYLQNDEFHFPGFLFISDQLNLFTVTNNLKILFNSCYSCGSSVKLFSPGVCRQVGCWRCRCWMSIWKSYCSPSSCGSCRLQQIYLYMSSNDSKQLEAHVKDRTNTYPFPGLPVPLSRLRRAGVGWQLRCRLVAVEAPLLTEETDTFTVWRTKSVACPSESEPRTNSYLLWLCFSVWLSTLSRRGKIPERLFTGDFTLVWHKHTKTQRII